ncbi:hypothetical protein [Leucobacter chinensis]|uniref:hypothetical protein n=1 Tax=Leucobacter chinensis TaxID=2851010 RepID=UPI001C217E38|nr:hypothetical protein [Leucobacter chinensis]
MSENNRLFQSSTGWVLGGAILGGGAGALLGLSWDAVDVGAAIGFALGACVGFSIGMLRKRG